MARRAAEREMLCAPTGLHLRTRRRIDVIQLLKHLVCGCLLASILIAAVDAQWLNYKTPGVPRKADGSPNLSAPAPRFLGGRPDLTGVWMHDLTPIDEMKRLFGAALVNGEIQTEVPG